MTSKTLYLMFGCCLSIITFSVVATDDATVLIEYQHEFSMLEQADNSVTLKLLSDGTVSVHYPTFMRMSGNYEYQVSSSELNNLMQNLRQLGVDQFDAAAASQAVYFEQQAALEAVRLPGQTATIITDQDITHLSISKNIGSKDEIHSFRMIGIRENAELYPQVSSLVNLATALDLLDTLTNDSRMQLTGAGHE